jgi:hypothetical protein
MTENGSLIYFLSEINFLFQPEQSQDVDISSQLSTNTISVTEADGQAERALAISTAGSPLQR